MSDWRKTWRKKEQKTQVVLLFVVVFVCVFVLIDDSLFLWLMLFVDCWWIWQTDRDEQVLCVLCVDGLFCFSFFFILWNELMNFVEDGKKGGKEKQESDWLQQKMFFVDCCWIDWLILFFEMDWKERIFWLFLIYEWIDFNIYFNLYYCNIKQKGWWKKK